jgi:NAD(P)-dependent dehydrogenase (short-subunit alcohol dehydrogenase family)
LTSNIPAFSSNQVLSPVALVTGAAKRLGREIALQLAQAGFDVLIHCHRSIDQAQTTAEQVRALGRRAEILVADLSDESACEALLPKALDSLGRVDAVVNNASIFEYDSLETVTHAKLNAHWAINLVPAVILSRALHRHLVERGARGCVVNMLDQKLSNPNPDYFSYTVSKAALESANTLLAQALAPVLRVVGVAPGPLLSSEFMTEEKLTEMRQKLPLGHGPSAEDVAKAVVFAIQNTSITGSTILLDAGAGLKPMARYFPFLEKFQ